LDELDSLFPSAEKSKTSGSGSKLRSSTLSKSKERRRSSVQDNSELVPRVGKHVENSDLDVQSQKTPGTAIKMSQEETTLKNVATNESAPKYEKKKAPQSPLLTKAPQEKEGANETTQTSSLRVLPPTITEPKSKQQPQKLSKKAQKKANKAAALALAQL